MELTAEIIRKAGCGVTINPEAYCEFVFARDAVPDHFHAMLRHIVKNILRIRRWGDLDRAAYAKNSIRFEAEVSLVCIENGGYVDVDGVHFQRFVIVVHVGGVALLHEYHMQWRITFSRTGLYRVQLLRSKMNVPFLWEGQCTAQFLKEDF